VTKQAFGVILEIRWNFGLRPLSFILSPTKTLVIKYGYDSNRLRRSFTQGL